MVNDGILLSCRNERHEFFTESWRYQLDLRCWLIIWKYDVHQHKIRKALNAAMAHKPQEYRREEQSCSDA
jgi:hypothetical protein